MPDDTSTPGGLFAQDIRAIREQKGISIEAIHEESKIPVGLIEAFEETALFDHTQFNMVYLRSFVRSYAEMVGIDAEDAVAALERAREGTYARELAIAHLGLDPTQVPQRPAPLRPDKPPVREAPLHTMPEEEPPVRKHPPSKTPSQAPAVVTDTLDEAATPQAVPSAPPSTQEVVWWRNPRVLWWLLAAVTLAVLTLIAIVLWSGGGSSGTEARSPDPTSPDTSELGVAESTRARPRIVLADTFTVLVQAAYDKVDPLRVTVDEDLRRPYWIEGGGSRTFRVTERIMLENQLDDIEVAVEGYGYPVNRRDAQGRLVLTRSGLQAYLDSLTNQ